MSRLRDPFPPVHPETAALYAEVFPDTGHRYWHQVTSGSVWFGQKPNDRCVEISAAMYRAIMNGEPCWS